MKLKTINEKVKRVKTLNEKVKHLKTFILYIVHLVVEPAAWNQFAESEDEWGNNYLIFENDIPIFRDLKAFLNLLSAIERITEKLTEHNVLVGVTIATQDLMDFRRNYKIYMATSNIMTRYLAYAKEAFINTILPQLKVKLIELSKLCTEENLEKIADFFIEQVISLEQYQDNYKASLQKKALPVPAEVIDAEKKDTQEDFITVVDKKTKALLKTIYKDQFDDIFLNKPALDVKTNNKSEDKLDNKNGNNLEVKPEEILDYYPENPKDTDIVKNIKLFLNGVIGVKKVFNDHTAYEQAGAWDKIGWFASLIKNLHRTYKSFNGFDYQAIIAEKSGPTTEAIKNQIKQWNNYLEALACVADQFEVEMRLKEGSLLKLVEYLAERYDEITTELRISVDYVRQKNSYYRARQQARKSYLRDIDFQVNEIKRFLAYKDYAISDIPYYILKEMKNYIIKYHDDICMDKTHLAQYEEYLKEALEKGYEGWGAYISKQVEYMCNRFGGTIHYEYMKMLNNRVLYLQNQKIYAINRFDKNVKYYQDHPYNYLNIAEITQMGHKKAIVNALKKHIDSLSLEKEKVSKLINNTKEITKLVDPAPKLLEEKNKPAEVKVNAIEEKVKVPESSVNIVNEKTKPPEKPRQRFVNQEKLKTIEYNIFSSAVKKYEETGSFQPLLDMVKNSEGLSAKTIVLIDEASEVIHMHEHKTMRLD